MFGGAYIQSGLCKEGNLRLKINWASHFFACVQTSPTSFVARGKGTSA